MSFSNGGGGGTLALPSPTHVHHMDVTAAVRTLRRSISRSPSKFLARTSSQSSDGSRQASPQSPCRRLGSTPLHQARQQPSNLHSSTPTGASSNFLASAPHLSPAHTPHRPSVKLSLRSAKSSKTSTPSRITRARASPKSPLKRALSATPDAGNSIAAAAAVHLITSSPGARFVGQENHSSSGRSTPRKIIEKPTRHSVHLDVTGASQLAFLKALDATSDSPMAPAAGALKRSDATMNLDQPNQGSPVAKRRSMHGIISAGADPSIFGGATSSSQSFDIHEDSFPEYELSGILANVPPRELQPSPTPLSNIPKRSSSLRKSTLQQRYGDRSSWGRRSGERQLSQLGGDYSTPVRSRPRLSTESFVPPPALQSTPFGSTTPLSNPPVQNIGGGIHQPHPLSKTLTTSTSGNSLTEELPLYAPTKVAPKPHPFSKSLPLNAARPIGRSVNERVVATPNHGNRLWLGAFNSTGLVSKVNRNPEEEADKKMAPPDTPCKKHSNPFATFPPPAGSAMKKRGPNRNSFAGVPTTPFNPLSGRAPDTFGNPGKGLSIFQRGSAQGSRRASILSMDGDDRRLFTEAADFSNTLEGDAPPTPTKNTLTPSFSNLSNVSEHSIESPSANRTFALPLSAVKPAPSREHSLSPADGRRTPQTPQENLLPIDTSRLSISQAGDNHMPPPVTPTTRDFRSSTSIFVTPVNARVSNLDVDASLFSKFDKVEQIGQGEFSTVYRVTKLDHQNTFDISTTTPSTGQFRSPVNSRVFAVKKSKQPYHGPKDRDAKLREARILQALSHAEHVVQYIDDWEHNFYLYIQTEFCEEGTLDKFLGNIGRSGRLDDFRIYKILQDLCLGLKEIHDAGFMHLDMKPANILVTFEGALKIGDFGLAQAISENARVDIEGDREYMAPEMLKGQVRQHADVFSLGLMILETAANVVLPDNGPTWVALRSGDLSEVPSLTWTPSSDVERDALGNPTESARSDDFYMDKSRSPGSLFGSSKRSELQQAPEFMTEAFHPSSLDSVVRWMTQQEPEDRPHVEQILALEGLRWVAEHRNAPATVYEGNWGPVELFPVSIAPDGDTEMMDV